MGETEQWPMMEVTCLDCAKYTIGRILIFSLRCQLKFWMSRCFDVVLLS